jgi:hypothetical protein
MKYVNPSTHLRVLARRYRQAEDAGFPHIFLIVNCAAGGLAIGGVVLLAYVQSHAMLILASVLAIAAALAVLLTIVVMISSEEASAKRDEPTAASEKRSTTAVRP